MKIHLPVVQIICFWFFSFPLIFSLHAQDFAGGIGTEAEPFLIENAQNLDNIRNYLGEEHSDKYFKQIAHIDLGVSPWNDGQGWVPIGDYDFSNRFGGSYDGNGFKIINLTIYLPDFSGGNYNGLFGFLYDAEVLNVTIDNLHITSYHGNTGGIAGQSWNSTISNCHVEGTIDTDFNGWLVGGIAGGTNNEEGVEAEILNCSFEGTIIAYRQAGGISGSVYGYSIINSNFIGEIYISEQYAGGIAGIVQPGSEISACYASGIINADDGHAGGLAGRIYDGIIINSYAVVNVSGNTYIGGLAGNIIETGTEITNCYAAGLVTGESNVGGLIGSSSGLTVSSSYYNETTGQDESAGGEKRTSEQMTMEENFLTWNFSEIWSIAEGESYPFLQWQGEAGDYNYPPLAPPSNLAATINDLKISLEWDASSFGNPEGYKIYRNNTHIGSVNHPETLFEDTDVTYSYDYIYEVTAYNPAEESVSSNSVEVMIISDFGGGAGTESNPYLVTNAHQLYAVRFAEPASFFKQTANIDLDVSPFNDGAGWLPIGSSDEPFTGNFDGDGKTIYNFMIHNPDWVIPGYRFGLFGVAAGSAFKNITIEDMIINSYVGGAGGIVAELVSGSVEDCLVSGSIETLGHGSIGGIAGIISDGTYIIRCAAHVNINGNLQSTDVGGLIGSLLSGSSISKSFATGNVSGLQRLGGLAGESKGGSFIEDSYATGNVTANGTHGGYRMAGGLIGYNSSAVIRSYAVGFVSCDHEESGGLIGYEYDNPEINSSYFNKETTGKETSYGGESRETIEMTNQSNYEEWDFNAVWAIDEGGTYPYLQWYGEASEFNIPSRLPPRNLQASPDNNSAALIWDQPAFDNPAGYSIYRDGNLIESVANTVKTYYDQGLTNHEVYTYHVTALYEGGPESTPSNFVKTIPFPGFSGGNGTEIDPFIVETAEQLYSVRYFPLSYFLQVNNIDMNVNPYNEGDGWSPVGDTESPFKGNYNGNNFNIINLMIDRIMTSSIGLFGRTEGAVLENIHLKNANINAGGNTGVLLGIGRENTRVINCSADGELYAGGGQSGGLIGNFSSGVVTGSWSSVNLHANGNITGGLIGEIFGGEVSDSYSYGNVTGKNTVGGLVGFLRTTSIQNCYARGEVSGDEDVGGLAGNDQYEYSPSTVANSFYDTEATGQTESTGGEGKTTTEMTYPYGAGTFADWDFDNTWVHDILAGVNNGYPYLKAEGIFSVKLESSDENMGSVTGSGVYNYGEIVTVTASPANPYLFIHWEDQSGNHVSDNTSYQFSIPESNQILTAIFESPESVLTIIVEPELSGTVNIQPEQETYLEGDIIELTAMPAEGYFFIAWEDESGLELSSQEEFTFPMPLNDATLTARFEMITYNLSYSAGSNGKITGEKSQTVNQGSDGTEITAVPDENYYFTGWSDGNNDNPRQDMNVQSNIAVTAYFENITHVITAITGENGTITPSGDTEVDQGADLTFTITPDEGYFTENVLVDGITMGALESYTFSNINSGHTISATFTDVEQIYHKISASKLNEGGSINPSGEVWVLEGENMTFNIIPNVDYEIADVIVDGVSIGPLGDYTFENVTTDHTIQADFSETYSGLWDVKFIVKTLDGSPVEGAEIKVWLDDDLVLVESTNELGEYVNDMIPGSYSYTVMYNGMEESGAFTVTNQHIEIPVTFQATFFTVTATAGTGGNISPQGEILLPEGDNISFTIIPADGYEIADVLVDGISSGQVSEYTFLNVATDHTIHADFSEHSGLYDITFIVEDRNGTPVPGAVISVWLDDQGVFVENTDENGRFVNDMIPGNYKYAVTYGDFEESGSFEVTNHEKDIVITLDFTTSAHKTIPGDRIITVYPNPSEGIFFIDFNLEKATDTRVDILDVTGKLILQRTISVIDRTKAMFDLGAHPKGIYFVVIDDGIQKNTTRIIIR